MFEDLVKHISAQRSECDNLKRQLSAATNTIVVQNASISSRIREALEGERRQAVEERQKLAAQIAILINTQAETQENRIADKACLIQKSLAESNTSLEHAVTQFNDGMVTWDHEEGNLMDELKKSRDQLKTKLKDDWTAANELSTSIQTTAKSVHAETSRVVDEQIKDLDMQMEALDDFVTSAKEENAHHHETHARSVQALSDTVEESFGGIAAHFKTTFGRVETLGQEMYSDLGDLQDQLEPLEDQLCQPLANLREDIAATALHEYQPTGQTPTKAQYHFPTELPRTEDRDLIIAGAGADEEVATPVKDADADRDNTTVVFADLDRAHKMLTSPARPPPRASAPGAVEGNCSLLGMSLREVNPNVTTTNANTTSLAGFDPRASVMSMPPERTMPLYKRSTRAGTRSAKKQATMAAASLVGEGSENLPLVEFAQSASRRKSPRLN